MRFQGLRLVISWKVEKAISLQGPDHETLLIAYLEDLIFLADQEMMVRDPKLNISLTNLDGDFPLYPLTKMMIEIKAVTYHEMDINQKAGLFRTRITFDI